MDGFFRKPSKTITPHKSHTSHTPTPKPAPQPTTPTIRTPKPAVARSNANHAAHRKPQPSKTLLRKAVSKPVFETPAEKEQRKILAHTAESERLKRAQAVAKSRVISRFGNLSQPEPIPKKVAPLSVKQPPEHATNATKPAHQKPAHTTAHTHESAAEAHFKKALAHANAHEKHAVKKPHYRRISNKLSKKLGLGRKGMRVATASLALVLLAGFFAYQNIPNISMQIAANRAGFSAHMPGYTPAGFGASGPVQYGPGYVAVNFSSRSDEQQYKVVQRVSNWNSEALADNFLAENGKQYQTFEDKGRTIYVYDGNNATWVNGGIWYQIEGANNLKNDELISIASSM